MCKDTPKMCKNGVESDLKNSRLYYSVLVMIIEALGKVTHLVSSQMIKNAQKYTKDVQE